MECYITANMLYRYDSIYLGKKLSDLIQDMHKFNCDANGWVFKELRPGCYGYDI